MGAVLVVMVIATLAVVAAAVLAFRGRGGEMSVERNDYVPLDLGPVSATDVALLRPPTALWGYNVQATDEAMEQIAESIRERDVRIVALEQLVTDLGRDHAPMTPLGSPYAGARHRRAPADGVADTATLRWAGHRAGLAGPGAVLGRARAVVATARAAMAGARGRLAAGRPAGPGAASGRSTSSPGSRTRSSPGSRSKSSRGSRIGSTGSRSRSSRGSHPSRPGRRRAALRRRQPAAAARAVP